jgi:TatD DNase family protein
VIFHCFSGDADFARRCVDRGYVLSLAGTVTFRNAHALRDAFAVIPSYQLLVETDAPFLTPHPFRGRPNEPYCAAYTLRALAQFRGVPAETLAAEVTATAERVFDLPRTTGSDTSDSNA